MVVLLDHKRYQGIETQSWVLNKLCGYVQHYDQRWAHTQHYHGLYNHDQHS